MGKLTIRQTPEPPIWYNGGMRRFLFGVVALAAGMCLAAGPVIDVRVEGVARQSLTLRAQGSGAGGAAFVGTLRNDLLRSGRYRLTEGSGQVRVEGTVSGAGETAQDLTVNWPGKRFAWTRGAATAEQSRRHAHELADAIVQATTGERGMAQSRFALVAKTGVRRDGTAIEDLYVCDYDGHNLRRVTRDGAPIVGPRWAANGREIYFTSYRLGYPAVFVADVASGVVRQLAAFRGLSTGAVPSPADPGKVALILSHQGNPELYVMDVATKRLTRLTETKLAAEASPCWSPDGRQICYVSDRSGSPQLYVVDVATKATRRLTLRGGENVQPDWGPNGIVFRPGARRRIDPFLDAGQRAIRIPFVGARRPPCGDGADAGQAEFRLGAGRRRGRRGPVPTLFRRGHAVAEPGVEQIRRSTDR